MVYMYIYAFVCLSVYSLYYVLLFLYLLMPPFVYLSIYEGPSVSVFVSFRMSICPFVRLAMCLAIHMCVPIHLCMYVCICLYNSEPTESMAWIAAVVILPIACIIAVVLIILYIRRQPKKGGK